MRDYKNRVDVICKCAKSEHLCAECPFSKFGTGSRCKEAMARDAADAIEELLAAVPPPLWTDEPIEGSEFVTHNQGGRGFEIHFRTDSAEKYKAVQEECRRQIDHAKTEPPKDETK